ncbi:ankyrin repeat domain-containing protein [Stylonychia lemnae]|uniref:Ankyrin repeat domain-containing protein n=1 Tax=Stylonychia lemnae TaxID=5949 RepID=A0A078BB53_STYLE|nr:ankyrin repeat domain-containing protein [Stylonychia lemnae]|eukprot:CDW91416.1 ankyrin repeat domain-containing protein [Stylonychia lemnae]
MESSVENQQKIELNEGNEEEEVEMSYEDYLVYSARLGEFDDVKMSIEEKVDPNYADESGNTALHMACANNFIEIAKYLLINGANPNLKNQSNNTPLHWAALNGRVEIVELLLEHKADPNIKNEFDRIPFEEALQNGFANVGVIEQVELIFSQEILAKVSILSDDKVYTSIQEMPEDQEEEKKGDDLFGDELADDIQEDDDKRSIVSEEAIRQEEAKPLTEEQLKSIEERKQKEEQQKLQEINQQMKDKFNMQEFEIEVKKIDENQIL